ncbi:N-acetyltransferase [Angomonas deanei]|uniref:Acetyltransferase (GNAT) family/Acetyltransferase (GNAT) domain containing protein, putative n=1 Tax=Angomonas deanei TaxID=59799 RepID=S9VEU0_9TRYP|nr:N-acetyltransferase [Angomonas deanei]EPY42330.1 N-acetyltransferase [Angomonas deanei]CAD2222984.1 Acetyltransferase (GNAT) family/Acetyltransferase (GNAT) domain containing protein, putative [Angomonas deanei]|eukprot:EPY41267.1 N-acetyltransferase [Angomonas deanei]
MGTDLTNTPLEELKGLRIRSLHDSRLTEKIRVIDGQCLLVKYKDEYYDTYVRNQLHVYNLVAYYHDLLVGSLTCRLEPVENTENTYKLYIMTICVLEPYRHMKIGTRMLLKILDTASKEKRFPLESVTLHMQVGSPVLNFYQQFGFEVVKEVKDYYNDLDVRDALLLRKEVVQATEGGKKKKK